MIVSYFKDNFYTIGVDYSWHSECIYQEDIDFDPNTQIAELEGEEGNFFIKISEKPKEEKMETEVEKFERIFKKICSSEIILNSETDHEILEGVEFSDKQIGDVIVAKLFKDEKTGEPNPHAQTAMIARAMIDKEYANSPKTLAKFKEVNDIRVFFGLAAFHSIK